MRTFCVWWGVTLVWSACSFERPPDVGRTVGGMVDGMWDGADVTLALAHDDGTATIAVDRNGSFDFPAVLVGSSYAVTVADQPREHTCAVSNGVGVAQTDTADVVVSCSGPQVAVELSAPYSSTFDPDQLTAWLGTSYLTSAVAVRGSYPGLTAFQVGGVPVPAGQWSAPIALADGPNPIAVRVEVGELSRDYELTVRRNAVGIEQTSYLKAPSPPSDDRFGASIAIDRDVLVVGAPLRDDGGLVDAGAVYVFRRTGTEWAQEAVLHPLVPRAGDRFGSAVAIDGDQIVVGAPGDRCLVPRPWTSCNIVGNYEYGAAYLFRRVAGAWAQQIIFKANNAGADDHLGSSVAISGGVVVVGAPDEASAETGVDATGMDDTAARSGAAYGFGFVDGVWQQIAYLKAANTDAGDRFGTSVAVRGDLALVGAPEEASASVFGAADPQDDSTPGVGAVYVFRVGTPWSQVAYLKGDADALRPGRFGTSVALDADLAMVGAPEATTGPEVEGRAYVFTWQPDWRSSHVLRAYDADDQNAFGNSVAVRGGNMMVGAWHEGGVSPGINPMTRDDTGVGVGVVYLDWPVETSWEQRAYIKASNPDNDDNFGAAIALGIDTLCVSAPGEASAAVGIDGDQQDDTIPQSGAVYCFR